MATGAASVVASSLGAVGAIGVVRRVRVVLDAGSWISSAPGIGRSE